MKYRDTYRIVTRVSRYVSHRDFRYRATPTMYRVCSAQSASQPAPSPNRQPHPLSHASKSNSCHDTYIQRCGLQTGPCNLSLYHFTLEECAAIDSQRSNLNYQNTVGATVITDRMVALGIFEHVRCGKNRNVCRSRTITQFISD